MYGAVGCAEKTWSENGLKITVGSDRVGEQTGPEEQLNRCDLRAQMAGKGEVA